ncbi:membrane protein [Phytohabitans rumicis]|uniref:Membrane protein n=1 Tax=Phytohabitans rumicis TaxID=1076125 RepID=A0A6V8KZV8_9ACTN|nr:membrane protein [Phytohabitans rumicis]
MAGLAVATALFLAYVPAHRGFFDVGVYHGAVHYWLRDGGQLYDYLRPPTNYGFTYPPFAALVLSPLALLDWHPAIALSLVVNASAGAALVYLLVDPVARRNGWPRGFAFAVAACAVAVFEPVRDTFSFGQVNLVLLALVVADTRLLRTTRWYGVGIGVATAIKLTPGIFVLYLLVTGQRRAAAVATGTAAAATFVALAVAPDASRTFWTEALWDTDRIGNLAYVSNQSLQGVLARLDPAAPSRLAWLLVVAAVLAVWGYRVRRVDPVTGAALTGVVGCLVSPITWVHHLVWVLPALVLLFDRHRRRWAVTAYVLLCSSVVWLWWDGRAPGAFLGANAYVWICVALLLALPAREVLQGQHVPVDAEAADHPGGHRGHHRVVPELLPGVDVRDVHLDERGAQHGAGVAHRVRIM